MATKGADVRVQMCMCRTAHIRSRASQYGYAAEVAHRMEHRRQSSMRILPDASVAFRPAQR